MLAPEVQATAIEVRVPLALDRSQCHDGFRGKFVPDRSSNALVWVQDRLQHEPCVDHIRLTSSDLLP